MDLGALRNLVARHRSSLLAIAISGLVMVAAFLSASVLGQARQLAAGGPPASESASPTVAPPSLEPQTPEPTATPDPAPLATAEPTVEPTPVPTPGPIAGWELVGTFDGGESIAGVHDVATWNGTFVALGEAWVSTDSGSVPRPRLWHSNDGRSWSEVRLQLGAGASVQALAPLADGSLMILGTVDEDRDAWSDPLQPAAWTSTDAVAWSPVALPLEAARDWGTPQFAASPEGLVATIDDRIWYSPDGRSWQIVYDAPRGTSLYGPVAGDEGWIVRRGNASLGTTTLLVSGDAVTWYDVDLGNVGAITTVAGDWLASRWTDDWARNEILQSANGLEWHVILDVGILPVEPSDQGAYDGATVTGTDELLVLSPWQAGHCYSMPNGEDVFWSRDGSTWVSAGLVDGAVVTHAQEIGDVSVLVGYIASTGDVAFWSSTR